MAAGHRGTDRSFACSPLIPLIDFLYPQLCLACGGRRATGETLLCSHCLRLAPPLTRGDPVLLRARDDLRHEGGVEDLAVLWQFAGPVRDIVHAMKYGGLWSAGEEAGTWLGRHIERSPDRWLPDLIVPVPLHPARMRERGYNQTAFVAKGLSRVLGVPVRQDAAERTRNTATQTSLDRMDRMANVAGAFRIRFPDLVRGAHILVVDDVVTTGATVCALAAALYAAGSPGCAVTCLAIAPGDPP